MTHFMPQKYYTPGEAAALAGVCTKTLQRWRKQGTGPVYQQYMRNGAVRYPCEEFLEWLQSHTN